MGKEIISTNRYVIGDEYFEIWKKNHKGYDEYEYEYCVAKDIKHNLTGYYFELSVVGGKIIKISVPKDKEDELRVFWDELQKKIKDSFNPKKAAKTLAVTASKAIPKVTNNEQEKIKVHTNCPMCKGTRFHAFVENEVVVPGKVKKQTTVNLNPLKPFTVYNHKEKVVRHSVTRQVSKFVCDDCGHIFQ